MAEAKPAPKTNRKHTGRTIMKWLKRGLGAAFVLIVIAMIVVAWLPKPVSVEVATVEQGAMRVTIDEDGRTRVADRYVVSSPLHGSVGRIELRSGDAVEEGTVLARIVPLSPPLLDARTRTQAQARVAAALAAKRQAQAGISRARTTLEFARQEAERQRTLASKNVAPARAVDRAALEERTRTEELTSAEFGERVARYELEMARAALGRIGGGGRGDEEQMEVPSPITGRVLRVIRESEGVVQAGTPLLEVGDAAALEIVVDILTSDAVMVEPGAQVSIERWGGDGALRGHVRLLEPSAFTRVSALGVEEQRVNVIIDLDEPHERWSALGDGYRVEARIIVWEEEDVLKVPASAVFRHGEEWAVFAIEDGVARLRTVELGRRNGLEAQVTTGLSKGNRVVVHPGDRVTDGVEVEGR